ncbi:MAG: YkgJ family cysteine cluster protein [Terriglobia bacterium]
MGIENIFLESGARYQCIPDCGFCCGFWNIHIDHERKDRLLEKDWVQEIAQDLGRKSGQNLFKIIGQNADPIIQRQEGTCSFINERKLCSIHAIEGYRAKPVACQQFPFIYYRTPRGLEVFLDHSCPEVIQNLGELVTPEDVRNRLASEEHVITVSPPIPLTSSINLDWASFEVLEKGLLEIAQKQNPIEERIHQMHKVILDASSRLGRESGSERAMDAIRWAIQNDPAPFLFEIASQPSPSSKRELYLAILMQLVESVYAKETRAERYGMVTMMKKVLGQWKHTGQIHLHVFGLKFDSGQMEKIPFRGELDEYRDILENYFLHLVRRLVGTGKIPILKRISIVATNYAMAKWFSRAHAVSEGRQAVKREDIVFAVKVVEKFLGNSLFNKINKERNFLSNYINFLYENPQLPRTMLLD